MLASDISTFIDWYAISLNCMKGMAEGLFILIKSIPVWLWILIAIKFVCGMKFRRR